MKFETIRPMFGGRMSQDQVDGINAINDAMVGQPVSWAAYARRLAGSMEARSDRIADKIIDKVLPGEDRK